MGFGTIAVQVVFVFLFLIVLGSYVAITSQHNTIVEQAIRERGEHDEKKLATALTLIADYNGSHVHANLTSTGTTVLNISELDFYLNRNRQARNATTLSIELTTDTLNTNLMDHGDVAKIIIETAQSAGDKYLLVTTPYGVKVGDAFVIS